MHTSIESSHVLPSAKVSNETDRYAPWVEATNIALHILKTVHVDHIREASPLNILAQRNDPNEVPISHGYDKSYRKPDVVLMTEEELIEVHKIKKTESGWQNTLSTKCQTRLPENTVQWRQFKAAVEFKRCGPTSGHFVMPFPKQLRSCRAGTVSYIKPQTLGGSVTHADPDAMWEPVPKACTFFVRSFLFQILTLFSYKPAARNGSEETLTRVMPGDQ